MNDEKRKRIALIALQLEIGCTQLQHDAECMDGEVVRGTFEHVRALFTELEEAMEQ